VGVVERRALQISGGRGHCRATLQQQNCSFWQPMDYQILQDFSLVLF